MQNFLFDLLPLESFKKGIYEKPYNVRINWLKKYTINFYKRVHLLTN